MNHRWFATMLVATVVAVTALFGTSAAHAQFPPPCGAADLTITNFTQCDIKFCLKGFTGGVTTTFCWFVPAAQTTVVPFPPGFLPGGVVNTGNNTTYPFVPHPFVAGWWWVPNITLGACCCDVFYDPATCTMWIRPTTSPGPCQ
jgi:hypothetical protein